MWCVHCRQDVPALPSADREYCCPRCGEAICRDAHHAAHGRPKADSATKEPAAAAGAEVAGLPPSYDGWELDEELRHVQRLLQIGKAPSHDADAIRRPAASRIDLPHAAAPGWHSPAAGHSDKKRQADLGDPGAVQGVFTWLALLLGATSFVCGGILLGWSLATGRHELWTIGLPVALAGQIGLVIGLVLQLDWLWRENREAAAKLEDVDEQLHELRATTTLLSASQGPATSTFYAHFAGGASPQLLLTDLKSQLDLLAMRIAQSER